MFPVPCPFQFGIGKCRHDIIDQSPIRPSPTRAGPGQQSSAVLSSHQPAQNHPPPTPLPDQFPIDRQLLAAIPRVRSSGAFRRRPAYPGSIVHTGPASETLTGTGGSVGSREWLNWRSAAIQWDQGEGPLATSCATFSLTGANGRVGAFSIRSWRWSGATASGQGSLFEPGMERMICLTRTSALT